MALLSKRVLAGELGTVAGQALNGGVDSTREHACCVTKQDNTTKKPPSGMLRSCNLLTNEIYRRLYGLICERRVFGTDSSLYSMIIGLVWSRIQFDPGSIFGQFSNLKLRRLRPICKICLP